MHEHEAVMTDCRTREKKAEEILDVNKDEPGQYSHSYVAN